MDIRPLDPALHVAPQIALEDVPALKTAGYAALISNRPDGEEPGQPDAATVRAAAEAAGLAFVHIPVSMSSLGPEEVEALRHALDTLPGPALAFCRSGTRSAILWALSQAGDRQADELIAAAAAAGYDLSGLRSQLG
ncbi:TIGR01244 family sulfur transferase [Brevundimonas sp.]|uniref:TIGR01244 family sulfur transferase n=1 Tax=Brevundimonas sp. TaxID=1871086 RepID=UPI0022BAD6F3|nr:TIGR01244 family sulfur transferase [Brevundimonas sp.]MCZ8193205.1 TIGR01244 family sulfur transferase [Brevundimonas sp.]